MTDNDDLHRGDDAATALTPEERVGLIPTWIVTRDDLNRAERANIAAALRWARRRRFDVLDADQLMALHKRMYGDVWRWAGQARTASRNPASMPCQLAFGSATPAPQVLPLTQQQSPSSGGGFPPPLRR